jgi:hypothetical protein
MLLSDCCKTLNSPLKVDSSPASMTGTMVDSSVGVFKAPATSSRPIPKWNDASSIDGNTVNHAVCWVYLTPTLPDSVGSSDTNLTECGMADRCVSVGIGAECDQCKKRL